MNGGDRSVCVVRQYYFPREAHVKRDVKALLEKGFQVDIICARDRGESRHEVWNGVNIYRLPVQHVRGGIFRHVWEYLAFFSLAVLMLTSLHLRKKYEIIEVDTMPDFLIFAAIVPKLLGAGTIMYLFENMPYLFAKKYGIAEKHIFMRFLTLVEKAGWSFADRLIFTHWRDEMPEAKSAIVLNVPDVAVFNKNRFGRRGEEGSVNTPAADGEIALMTHSTLTETYGIQTIISAVARLKGRHPGIRLKIVGEGEYKPELVRMTERLGLEHEISFEGFVPFESIPGYIEKAHIGVVSILSDYLLTNKLFEYVAMGVPAICSDWQTVKRFFSAEEILYYNAGDPADLARRIEEVLSDYGQALKRAERAFLRYRDQYSWDRMKSRYQDLYSGLAE